MRSYLSLGSNLGNKEQNILKAYKMIEEKVGTIIRKSSLYATSPWGFCSENEFLNSAICIETELSPRELLLTTQDIERFIGRTAKATAGYQDRIIDIDILLYDDRIVNEPDLKIPHPLMEQRDFVMTPLKEILDN